jgi:hypothetical protein
VPNEYGSAALVPSQNSVFARFLHLDYRVPYTFEISPDLYGTVHLSWTNGSKMFSYLIRDNNFPDLVIYRYECFNFSDADFDDSIEDPFDTREIFDLIRNDMTLLFLAIEIFFLTFWRQVVVKIR